MKLIVLLNGEQVGIVEQQATGQLVLTYDNRWRGGEDAYPLSLSMPLALGRHLDAKVHPFLAGLLPDNEAILDSWGREFGVSARNPFALLSHMGEDCAGAVQLVRPERLNALANEPAEIDWLSQAEIASRLRDATSGSGTGRIAGDRGRFSLAGAQPKTALLFDGKRWGIPSGRVPTTHILKPPVLQGLDGLAVNEHFSLRLAGRMGLPVAESSISDFEGERAIVLKRYDRAFQNDGSLGRLHQEDMCQALAVPPLRKYENEGGPGAQEIVDLLLTESSDPGTDAGLFFDALALNWAIAGTDAHAKNYSMLVSATSVRLAPLYDLISALPYPEQIPARGLKLAMRVDREYEMAKIWREHWEGLAERCDLDRGPVVQRVQEVVSALPAAVREVAREVRKDGIEHPVVDRLEEAIPRNCEDCLSRLT